jgi:hypothetical protein
MKFTDKYARASDKEEDKQNKSILSEDAYAIAELLHEIVLRLSRGRI